jgi:manganese-dependent inorganic pyrophosphatase
LVILGNRADDQLCAIEMEASCIVVGLGAKVSKSIQKLAMDHECVIIISPHDTYTIARLINQSIPIKHLMTKENLVTFSTNDFLDDIKDVMKTHRHRDFPILNKRNKYIGTISRRNLIGSGKKKLILVDHNEKTQAVDNVDEAEILEIIDHHRLGSLETISPILFRNEPVGCTATIMYQIYHERNLDIPKEVAGILCAAIISDTLMFRSPTCTELDKKAAESLAVKAEIKIEEFARAMFKAGSNLKEKSSEEIFYQDFKKFNVEESNFGVGQINSMDADQLNEIKNQILPQLEKECEKHGIPRVYFMLTNIIEESTELLFYGDGAKELVKDAFELNEIDENSAVLPGVVSRKKQLIPRFMMALQEQI